MTMKNASEQLSERLPSAEDLLRWIMRQEPRGTNLTDGSLGMLSSFALGTLVGGAVALLFAPRSGEELRGELGQRLDEAKQRVNERLGEASERVREAVSPHDGPEGGETRSGAPS